MMPQAFEQSLTNPRVTDLCINGTRGLFVDQGRGMELVEASIGEEDLRSWVLEQLSQVGKTWDAKLPFVDATLKSGHRAHIAFPPLAQAGILVSLRRLPEPRSITQAGRWSHSPLYPRLVQAVRSGDSVMISGATGSGKTTLASDLLSEVSPKERILALEDTQELAPAHPHFLSLISRPPNADGFGEVTLRTLLKQTLRMRPDRIVLGECRGPEVLELLQALNTGHRGAMATIHSNSPRDALRRIELLCLLAGSGTIPIPCIRELLCLGIQWIAQVERSHVPNAENGDPLSMPQRILSELWRVEGREGDTVLMRKFVVDEG